jgi:RNA polymerase sigma factor (sigma-70 family)
MPASRCQSPVVLALGAPNPHVGLGSSADGRLVPDVLPIELTQLLAASTEESRDAAWAHFIDAHHKLLLHVARTTARDHDAAMDAYVFILDRLRENDFRRLRTYAAVRRSTITTWLVVVAKRLCVDFARARYGRLDRGKASALPEHKVERRRLIDLAGEEIDISLVADPSERTPETEYDAAALRESLRQAIAALEPQDRLVLALRFEDGLTAEQIAATLEMPSAFHVYRRLNRIVAALRRRMREMDEGNPAA